MENLLSLNNILRYEVIRPILFLGIFTAAWIGFFYSFGKLLRLVFLGRYEARFKDIPKRIYTVLKDAFAQYQPLRYLNSGIKHFFFFWGFMIVSLETLEYWIQGVFPHFKLPILNTTFKPAFLLMEDTIQFLVILAIGFALVQRFIFKTKRLENTLDSIVILTLIFTLMFTSLVTKAGSLILEGESFTYSPFSKVFGYMMLGANLSLDQIFVIKEIFWWWHVLTVLGFLNYLPYSKHIHIITAIPNILFRRLEQTKCNVEPLDLGKLERGEVEYYGVKKLQDFTWKQLFDFISCTECGRCSDLCPATNTGKVLSPMHLVHKLKDRLKYDGTQIIKGSGKDLPPIADGVHITEDEIWDCTTCGACEEICPVGIEHPRFIMDMRRYLVFDQKMPPSAGKTLQKVMNQGNPWGLPQESRDDFVKQVGFEKVNGKVEAEYLYWMGCAGYFEPSGQKIVLAMKKILDSAGIKVQVLGSAEKCTGDPARRLGEEGLFAMIAKENIDFLNSIGVKKILTHCPHCFQTIKHDYKQYGGNFEVIHHSQFIKQLIDSGKLKVNPKKNGAIAYHDSCYMGRYNSVYDAPREIISKATGAKPLEALRNRQKSMCCGAGGGKMWFEEDRGTRVNYKRFEEFEKINAEQIAVACPYCFIMLSDATKYKGVEDKVKVKDISQVLAESIE
ncbi:MAG: (Fe-S)-binding protein [Candidatus Calescibacterium sp.]|nr:(Fe-S)-binding protein [Candidatus Calescibacterium sp.]MCX7734380.1 (Fe-S)-binding protein [bacterium]MDW8086856.1 (Fe-S)-binding protein [Candidatus Calescibacterium sp.]